MRAISVACAALLVGVACGSAEPPLVETPAQTRNVEGVRRLDRGDLAMAEDAFQGALREAELIDDLGRQGEAWSNLGTVAMARGDWNGASFCFARALAIYAQSPARGRSEVSARANHGSVLLELGRAGEAKAQFEQASRLAAQVGDARGGLLAEIGLATVKLRTGDIAAARQLAGAARARAEPMGDLSIVGAALGVEGGALEAQGDLARAAEVYERALAMDREAGNPVSVLSDLRGLGRVATRRGDRGRAALLTARAARVEKSLGRFDEAEADLGKAVALAQGTLGEEDLAALVREREALQRARGDNQAERARGR
jgi:tetratricopeptide (TPR) repeat protein